MSNQKSTTSRGSEKTDNHHCRRESSKAAVPVQKSSTAVLPPKATPTASTERSGATPFISGNALKVDATRMPTDDCPEVGTASTSLPHLKNRAGNIARLWSTDPHLARSQSSTETDFLHVATMPSQPSPTTIADHASASHGVRNGNAAGEELNAEVSGDQGPESTDTRSRERLIFRGTTTTTPVQETVSPWQTGRRQRNATNSQEGSAQSPQSTVSPLSTLFPDTHTMVTAGGTYASQDVFGSVKTSSVNPVLDGPLFKCSGPLPAPSAATGQQAETQVANPAGSTVTEGSAPQRTRSMTAASTKDASPTGLEDTLMGLNAAHSIIHTANAPWRQEYKASLARSPELEESFYERMASIRPSPQQAMAKSSMIGGWAAFVFALLCGTFIALILIFAVIPPRHKKDADAKICDTEDCLLHASLLKASLNLSVDPCLDFSAFVCSRWVQKKTEFHENVHSVMDNLRYSWYNNFDETLRLGSRKLPVGKKPLAMYEMCMSDFWPAKKASRIPLMLSLLLHLPAGWPNITDETISAVSLAAVFAYKWQAPFWLTVTVLDDRRLSSGRRRVVVKPGAYLPLFLRQHRAAADSYGQYMSSYINAYLRKTDDRPIHLAEAEVNSIRDMEADVLEQLNTVYSQRKPSVLTFAELNAMVVRGSGVSGNWLRNFQDALSLEPQLTPQDDVLVSNALLFKVLAGLVEKYGDLKLKYLLIWQFVQLYVPLGDLRLLATRFGSTSKANIYRPVYCAHHVEASFKVLALSLSIAAGFTAEIRDRIDARFDSLVSSALKKVNSSTWLDEESKLRMVNKLALVKKLMWPPQSLLVDDVLEKIYADVSENETSVAEFWIKSRLRMFEVNEYTDYNYASRLLGNNFPLYIDYDYIFNSVNMATGVAAAPAYYRNGTAAMFYGGLGFLMAMQLVKSIDEVGLQWKAAESIVDSILSHSSHPAYDERVRCLNESGAKSIFPEIPALEIVISAFEETTLFGELEHLALSAELPAGKVFFLTICYMTCATREHSNPMAADCNKVAQNSDYFAKVYDCPKGSRMNPENKCSFFS